MPVEVGEHPVEHDEVGLAALDGDERVAAVRRLVDLVALVAERRRDGVDDRRLVVDDEDPAAAAGEGLDRIGRVHGANRVSDSCASSVNEQ